MYRPLQSFRHFQDFSFVYQFGLRDGCFLRDNTDWFMLVVSECQHMRFGRNCAFFCGYCKHDETCDPKTGLCFHGCAAGYDMSDHTCKKSEYYFGMSKSSFVGVCLYICVCVCLCMCVCMCVCVCDPVCVFVCTCI